MERKKEGGKEGRQGREGGRDGEREREKERERERERISKHNIDQRQVSQPQEITQIISSLSPWTVQN